MGSPARTRFRVRFPVDVEGAMPVSGVAGAVVGRTFGFPSVDVAEVPFTLDYPAYDWFGLSSCVRVELGEGEARVLGRRGGHPAGAIGGIWEMSWRRL